MSEQEHQTFIQTPKQLIAVVVLAFVVPVLLIIMLTQLVTGGPKMDSRVLDADAVRERIRPVAGFNIIDANAPKVLKTGQQVFDAVCVACHGATSAVPKSPKIGDKAAWAPLIKAGLKALTDSAIKGVGGMPARGGNPDLSDLELARAIAYMANGSGGNFKEPEGSSPAPSPAAAASDGLPAKVYFDTGKAVLTGAGAKAIDSAAAAIKGGAGKVDITGYTDKTGDRAQNLELAKERAKAVRAALEKAGIANDRINMRPPEEITGGANDAEARRVEINAAK